METLLEFLKSQKALVLACHDGDDIWIANVYFGADDRCRLYFVSPETSRHSQMIMKNPRVAYSVVWFNDGNHKDRKGLQGTGACRVAKNDEEIMTGVRLHNEKFPEFASRITVDWIHNNEFQSRVWVIEPDYMKHWNDEKYGAKESQEFRF
jgi:uncharacterized protein YhbP (UPF0306 family)